MAAIDWTAKFKTYCEQHKDILHDEVSNKAFLSTWNEQQKKNKPVITIHLIEKPATFSDEKDNVFQYNHFELMITKSIKKQGYDEELEAYNFCLRIAGDFVARMKKERGLPPGSPDLIPYFKISECRTEKVALLDADNRYGQSLYFTVGCNNPVPYDESRWNL